jgi:hypothetical protein
MVVHTSSTRCVEPAVARVRAVARRWRLPRWLFLVLMHARVDLDRVFIAKVYTVFVTWMEIHLSYIYMI